MNTRNLKVIGKGAFTICYQLNKKEVILKSIDPIKECMGYGWFPDSKVFPEVKVLDEGIYKMEYYPRVKSLKNTLKPKQYEIYKELRELNVRHQKNSCDYFNLWHKEFDKVKNKRVREALKNGLDACGNYGLDIQFEISPRNVAVKNGMLILLDCFFIKSKLEQVRSNK